MSKFQGVRSTGARRYTLLPAVLLFSGVAFAQSSAPSETPAAVPAPVVPQAEPTIPLHEDKRAYGVLPNYRTAEAGLPYSPITNKQKLTIGLKDSFDGVAYPLAAFFSGLAQLSDSNPSFGQGAKGYAHRYATAFADQVAGNMLTESLLPIALHEDPRFFRKGTGSGFSRAVYAATRVIICKNDKGTNTFNASEVLGNGMVGALGNTYYPDARGLSSTAGRMFTQIGTDCISNVLKEFWPDVKAKLMRRKHDKLESVKTSPVTGG